MVLKQRQVVNPGWPLDLSVTPALQDRCALSVCVRMCVSVFCVCELCQSEFSGSRKGNQLAHVSRKGIDGQDIGSSLSAQEQRTRREA